MYLTAQRVVRPPSPRSESESESESRINAYYHEHGKSSWSEPPRPELDPGSLVRGHVAVAPPGNRVRSFIDLVAPDGTPRKVLTGELAKFLVLHTAEPLPWEATTGTFWFRIGMEAALAKDWRAEVGALLGEALKVMTP